MKSIFFIVLFSLIFISFSAIALSRKMKIAKFDKALRSVVIEREKKTRKLDDTELNFDNQELISNNTEGEGGTYLPIDVYVSNAPNVPENNKSTA